MLAQLPKTADPNLLVGFDSYDDASIYRLTAEMALVATADIITPPVDDPYVFGQIAAANALSDVYAMGGRPVTCLSLAAFPSKKLGVEVLGRIMAGALDKITAAGAVMAGGHTIEDDEPKFGLAVNGIVHPQQFWRNSGAQPGDVLILTKPVGSGVLFNANLKNWVSAGAMDFCIKSLIRLNKAAAEVLADYDVHAATDVTGFGLAGHGFEMAESSGVSLEIQLDAVPIFPEALQMYERGMSTGVNAANHQMVAGHINFERDLAQWQRQIVFDPQTNGGLLVALPIDQSASALTSLQAAGVTQARVIGQVCELRAVNHLLCKSSPNAINGI